MSVSFLVYCPFPPETVDVSGVVDSFWSKYVWRQCCLCSCRSTRILHEMHYIGTKSTYSNINWSAGLRNFYQLIKSSIKSTLCAGETYKIHFSGTVPSDGNVQLRSATPQKRSVSHSWKDFLIASYPRALCGLPSSHPPHIWPRCYGSPKSHEWSYCSKPLEISLPRCSMCGKFTFIWVIL